MTFFSRTRDFWCLTWTTRRAIQRVLGLVWISISLSAPLLALGQDREPLEVRSLAATCAACHGTEGRSQPGSSIPSLAHLPQPRFMARMRAFREDDRLSGSVMAQIAKGYTDQQVARLAAYFASVP